MSLTPTSHDNAPSGNFSSMLDRLTGLSAEGDKADAIDRSGFDIEDSATDYQPISASRETALQLARQISSQLGITSKQLTQRQRPIPRLPQPVEKLNSGSKAETQGVKLTYEEALRRHSRQPAPRKAQANPLPQGGSPPMTKKGADTKSKASALDRKLEVRADKAKPEAVKSLKGKGRASSGKSPIVHARVPSEAANDKAISLSAIKENASQTAASRRAPQTRGAAASMLPKPVKATQQKLVQKLKTASPPTAVSAHKGKTSRSATAMEIKPQTKSKQTIIQTHSKISQNIETKGTSPSQSGKGTKEISPRKTNSRLRDSSTTSVRTRTHTYLARPAVSPDTSEPQIRDLLRDLGLSHPTSDSAGNGVVTRLVPESEQRKSMVSMRLNPAELNSIRLRAEESGVSVCAYIRLCVLEAEQLRTEVKLALNIIRSDTRNKSSSNMPMDRCEQTVSIPLSPWLVRLKKFAAEILHSGFQSPQLHVANRPSSVIL